MFTAVLTSSATQAELAERFGVNRTTIRPICKTAKKVAWNALPAAVPGRRAASVEAVELAEARARIAALEATICEQAMKPHVVEGKDGWG